MPAAQRLWTPQRMVRWDATGAGNDVNGQATTTTSTSWSHTATAGAYALAFMTTAVNGGTTSANSATYGGTSMTLLTSIHQNNSSTSGICCVFGLPNVAGGAQTVVVSSTASTAVISLCGNSVSYLNVGSAGTKTTSSGFTSSMSVSATGIPRGIVVGALGANQTSALTISAFNQTQRYVHNGGSTGTDSATVIGDTPTIGALSLTATLTGTAPFWGGLGVSLLYGA
jgi:hypothetical protein